MSEQAFATLYARYRALVVRAVRAGYTNSPDEESICQQAWVNIWRNIRGFRHECSLSTWIFNVAQNAARMECRRDSGEGRSRKKTESLDSLILSADGDVSPLQVPAPSRDLVSSFDAKSKIGSAIGRLPRRFRAVIISRFLSELTSMEAAKLMGITVGAVKSYQYRALRRLRELIEEQE